MRLSLFEMALLLFLYFQGSSHMSGASVAVGVCREGRMPNLEPASVFYQLGGFFTRQNEKCFTATTTTTRMLRAENGERMMRKREKKRGGGRESFGATAAHTQASVVRPLSSSSA